MTGLVIFITFWQSAWDVVSAGVAAHPWLSAVTAGWILALMFCVNEALERRGNRATVWGIAFGALFGLWLAIAPTAAA